MDLISFFSPRRNFSKVEVQSQHRGLDSKLLARIDATLSGEAEAKDVMEVTRHIDMLGNQIKSKLEELKDLQAQLRTVQDVLLDALVTVGSDALICGFNPAAEKMFGLSEDEVLGKPVDILLPDFPLRNHFELVKSFLSNDGSQSSAVNHTREVLARRSNGETFPAEISISVLRTGHQTYFYGLLRDITERKKYEKALLDRESYLATIFDVTVEGLIIHDGSVIVDLNRSMCNILGVSNKGALIGKPILSILKGEHRERAQASIDRGGNSEPYEVTLTTSDSLEVPVTVQAREFELAGKVHRLVSVNDLTKLSEKDRMIRVLNNAINQASDMIIVTDNQPKILVVNDAFCRITGYSREEVIGKNPNILKSGQMPDGFYEDMWTQLLKKRTWEGHVVNKYKDGRLSEDFMSITPLMNGNPNKPSYYLAVKRPTRPVVDEEQLRLK